MKCTSEFQELANHNPFVQSLIEDGYHVDYINANFIIYGLPYLDKGGELKYGDWITPLELVGWVIDSAKEHQAWFHAESRPHDRNGRELSLGGGPNERHVTQDFVAKFSFSLKLHDAAGQNRLYESFEEKVTTYLDVITGPAIAKYPDATPLQAIAILATEQHSPLRFPDTLSAHYNVADVASLLRDKKVAIVGLGGTGSYILDFLARTHLEKIALFDDDKVHMHTIFRMPGFIPKAFTKKKVDALADQYGNWHQNIVPVPERVDENNIEGLREFHFVFISVDNGPSRDYIVNWLTVNGIPFVDCGMGLNRVRGGLNGVARIAGVDRAAFERSRGTKHLPIGDVEADEYRRQAQIAELNALNASFAVIRFKQHFNLYARLDDAVSYIFETASFELDPWGQST